MALIRAFLGTSTEGAGTVAGVATVGAGPGISVTGTGTNPIVNNTGVLTVAGGSGGVTIGGTAQNPTINIPAATTSTLDLFLSYGRQDASGVTPGPGTAITPSWYLRPDTDLTVQSSVSGSPGAIWEYPCFSSTDGVIFNHYELQLFVYQCALSGTGPTLTVSITKNGVVVDTSINLNGVTNGGFLIFGNATFQPNDRVGVFVNTTNVTSGTLMMTAHVRLRS